MLCVMSFVTLECVFHFFFFFKVSHLKRQKTMSVDGFSNSKLKLLHLKKKIRTEFECTFIHISQPRVVGTAHQTP